MSLEVTHVSKASEICIFLTYPVSARHETTARVRCGNDSRLQFTRDGHMPVPINGSRGTLSALAGARIAQAGARAQRRIRGDTPHICGAQGRRAQGATTR